MAVTTPPAPAAVAGVRRPSGPDPRERRTPGVPTVPLTVVELALGALAVTLATVEFTPFFTGTGWLAPVLTGVVVGVGLALVVDVRRWPSVLVAPIGLAGLVVHQLYALHVGATLYGLPTPAALRATADGLLSGWAQMLTVAVPADVRPSLTALPAAVGLVAAYVTSTLVLRTRAVTGVTAPAVVALVVALAIGAGREVTQLPLTAGLLVTLLVLLLVRANHPGTLATSGAAAREVGLDAAAQRRHSTLGRVLFGLPGVLLVVAVAAAGTLVLPIADGSDRADPRTARTPEIRLASGLSPLVEVGPQLAAEPAELYRVRVTGTTQVPVDRVRLAALDTFDGALWTQSGTFALAGSRLPDQPAPAAGADVVTLDVEPLDAASPFLPVVGRPLTVRGESVAVPPDGDTLMRVDHDGAPVAGSPAAPYTLTAQVAHQKDLDAAGPPPGGSLAPRLTALPEAPAWVAEQARAAAGGELTPWLVLNSLQDHLTALSYDPDARAGHSYGAVRRTLVDLEPGFAEQYASAFAILARQLGYPTRVAVGYRLDPSRLVDGTHTVTTADAHAWPEVLLDGYGWVVFEPTNVQNPAGPQAPRDPEVPVLGDDDAVAQPAQADPDADDARAETPGATLARVARTSAYVVAALAAVTALTLTGIALAKHLRRARRRRHGTPAHRVSAAWREVTDRLRELGYPTSPTRTPVELAALTRDGPAAPAHDPVTELALVETVCVFGPTEPTGAAARHAWELEGQVRARLDAQVPLTRRVLAHLDPRPLLPTRTPPARVSPTGWRGTGHAPGTRRTPAGGARTGR